MPNKIVQSANSKHSFSLQYTQNIPQKQTRFLEVLKHA
jgi:hypothetical protein